MMPFSEDRSIYFDTVAGFAQWATWSLANTKVRVIFDNGYASVQLGDVEVSSTSPQAIADAEEMEGVAVGQTLKVSGVLYTIRNVQPDGQGIVTLTLQAP